MIFRLKAPFVPSGDQPAAITRLSNGLSSGLPHQTLLGVTGSGKTFTVANTISQIQKPALIISHNKVLAAQLWEEFKSFFPEDEVHYFVSYYDYYQPEAYIPQSDTYIEKDSSVNEELDRLRHATTQALLTKQNVIAIASVSCIYNIGSPHEYKELSLDLTVGQKTTARKVALSLISLQYTRNDIAPTLGTFRLRGAKLYVYPPAGNEMYEIAFNSGKIESLRRVKNERAGITNISFSQAQTTETDYIKIFPAKFWVSPQTSLDIAVHNIEAELAQRVAELERTGKILEAARLKQRTNFDMAMIRETGYCHGIENYSRHFEFRVPGDPPYTLIDYFNTAYGRDGWITVIDESHMTIPQIRGMVHGDWARKDILIDYGFRLPSARDNRPLLFKEFTEKIGQALYTSATPGAWELERSETLRNGVRSRGVVEQIIRPTGLLDPTIEIRPSANQIENLLNEVSSRAKKNQRTLILTITKRLAEELSSYLNERGVRVDWLHSEVKTLDRPERLSNLRRGDVDAIVGINLLREGLDLPEVSLIAILDADKEGFLRNFPTLIQMIGRASRNSDGHVIMYADTTTNSMRAAIEETARRRKLQETHNTQHGITPRSVLKTISRSRLIQEKPPDEKDMPTSWTGDPAIIASLRKEMTEHAKNLRFEEAARIRNLIRRLSENKTMPPETQ